MLKCQVKHSWTGRYSVLCEKVDVSIWSFTWPCFGAASEVIAYFNEKGDLVDCTENKGMDESAKTALLLDMQAMANLDHARARGWSPSA